MKQFGSHGVTFFYNEEFTGDVHMHNERGAVFVVPAAALDAFLINLPAPETTPTDVLECAEAAAAELRAVGFDINALTFLGAMRRADEKLAAKAAQTVTDRAIECMVDVLDRFIDEAIEKEKARLSGAQKVDAKQKAVELFRRHMAPPATNGIGDDSLFAETERWIAENGEPV